jgi:uncharacterized DUF497 family protein
MESLSFAWDENKNTRNQRKHGISFEEASTVFYDEEALDFYDPDHSEDEDRFVLLGMSLRARVLVVISCEREKDSVVRIISARRADRQEEKDYWRSAK